MSKFQEGQIKLEGSGRKKGTPNKKSRYLAQVLEAANIDIPTKLIELLPQLPVVKQADILMGMMAYVYPKRKAVEITEAPTENQNITVTFVKPDSEHELKVVKT